MNEFIVEKQFLLFWLVLLIVIIIFAWRWLLGRLGLLGLINGRRLTQRWRRWRRLTRRTLKDSIKKDNGEVAARGLPPYSINKSVQR